MKLPTWRQSLQAVSLVVGHVSFAPDGRVTGAPIVLKQPEQTHRHTHTQIRHTQFKSQRKQTGEQPRRVLFIKISTRHAGCVQYYEGYYTVKHRTGTHPFPPLLYKSFT